MGWMISPWRFCGLTEADVDDIPKFGISALKMPSIITATTNFNWPLVSTGENFWDRALANGSLAEGEVPYVNGDVAGATASSALDEWAKEEETRDDIDPEEGGWELDVDGEAQSDAGGDDDLKVIEDEELGAGATPGVSKMELWVCNSPFAADHVAAGSFETAMQASFFLYIDSFSAAEYHVQSSAVEPTTWCCKLCCSSTALHQNLSIISHVSITVSITTPPPSTSYQTQYPRVLTRQSTTSCGNECSKLAIRSFGRLSLCFSEQAS